MRRGWLWAGAGIAVLALAGWLAVGQRDPATGGATVDHGSDAELAGPASDPVRPMPRQAAQGSRFQTRLLPDADVGADPTSVRIGLARISPEDAAAYDEWVLGGAEGTGPASVDELATVERWVPAPAQRLNDGSVLVGPVELPAADRYELQARGTDSLHYYAAAFAWADAPPSLPPVVAAGLRVHRDPAGAGDARVLLRRVASDPAADHWQRLLEREAPELLAAFDEAALPIAMSQVLAPLPPGRVDVVLQVDGVEAQTLPVTLLAGQVTDVTFDPLAEAVASAVSVDLELEFVVRGSDEPIEELNVTWFGPRGETVQSSDASGRVHFEGLDRVRTHRFTLQAEPPADGLPRLPELQPLEIAFGDDASSPGRLQQRRIELPQLAWIVAHGGPPSPGTTVRRSPYPIHVLQQQRDDAWADVAAAFFIQVEDGLAVSVEHAGTFRIATVISPWRILYSTPASMRDGDPDEMHPVDLDDRPGHATEITLLQRGIAMPNTPVRLRGPTRGLPPERMTTDARGQLMLDGVTVPTVWIEVADGPERAVQVRGATVIVDLASD